MSGARGSVEERDLHAHIDGQLNRERADAVDVYLGEHPDEQARLTQYAEQRRLLRAALGAPAAEPIPPRLRVVSLLAAQRFRWRRHLAQIAAAVGFVVLGGVGGWSAREVASTVALSSAGAAAAADEKMVTSDAISAHRTFSPEVRHPVEVDASQEPHLVQWLSKRLGKPLVVPDLTSGGFNLMGGRLLPAENGQSAAQFMYENGKDRLTLYLRAGIGGETAFRFREEDGIGAFYWSDEGFGYAIAGKVERDLLLRLAEIIYHQTSPDAGKAKIPPPPGKPS